MQKQFLLTEEGLKKLEEEGYVNYYQYKGVKLTDKGFKIARSIVRKHRLLETFLYNTLGIDVEDLHEQACAMEHSLSDEAERKMCQLLDYPNQCPDDHNIIPVMNVQKFIVLRIFQKELKTWLQ